jgi:tRNA pseudouridine55 synthase
MTSRKVVDIVRDGARYRGKIGHSGTLDPMATGLLVLCLGRATRLATYLIRDDKSYLATMELGVETDTGDADGEVVARNEAAAAALGEGEIRAALDRFRGVIEQVPPRFSARKVGGKRAYELARDGREVELRPSRVEVKELDILEVRDRSVRFHVKCSSGTYIRSLAVDVGRLLGTGARLTALRRLVVGPFSVGEAERLDRLVAGCRDRGLRDWLFPPSTVLGSLSRVVVDGDGERLIRQGAPVDARNFTLAGAGRASLDSGQEVQVWNRESDFVAVGRMDREAGGEMVLYPAKVLG